jgi:DNA-binding response OmpR family regulator
LLEADLAGTDGFETCRRLRQLPGLVETPVIFMIGLCEPQDRMGAFTAGGDDYVTKPFQYQEVLARVRLHLRHHTLEFELDRLHRQLDKRVAERTVELKAAIAESETLRSRLERENHALREEIRKREKLK